MRELLKAPFLKCEAFRVRGVNY